jgi:hypothetical protein
MATEILIGFLIILGILIVLFLILREVLCWYWKINETIAIQQEQLKIQKETQRLIESLVKANHGLPTSGLINTDSKGNVDLASTSSKVNNPNPEILNNEETETVNSKIPLLKENEIIVIHSISRVIKRIHKTEFAEGKGWIIVKEFGK